MIDDNGDGSGLDSSKERGNSSLERGLSLITRGGQAIVLSQKGKKDTLNFTLQVSDLVFIGWTSCPMLFGSDITTTHFAGRQASSGKCTTRYPGESLP